MYALLLLFFASHCSGSLYESKMYITLDQTSPCVLRMNGTHTFGCTSPRLGNVGVLHFVRNSSDLNWVLSSSPMDSYVVILNTAMFVRENLLKMNSSSKVSGVVLAQDQPRSQIKPISPEDTCPNRYSGLATAPKPIDVCETPWNPVGNGLLQDRWHIPMFFIRDNATISQLYNCSARNAPFDESQTTRSLCALQLSSHMYGSVDSRTCLRRSASTFNINPIKYCDVMGGDNVYLPIVPLDKFKPARKSYIIVATRLDAASFFYQNNPASLSVTTSLATLILTAKLLFDLTKAQDKSKYDRNVLFIFFSGEAYDYIGSSRVVYDLQNNRYPSDTQTISKDDIDLYIELSQLLNASQVYHHTGSKTNPNSTSFINKFAQTFPNLAPSNRSTVPPSSMHNFLILNPNLASVLFTSYDDQFTNQHYHSLFDDDYNIRYQYVGRSGTVPDESLQSFVANFATSLAKTLYEQITGSPVTNASTAVTKQEADELLNCYVNTLSCDLAKETGINGFFPEDIDASSKNILLDYYVGVTHGQTHWITLTTKLFLYYFTDYNNKSIQSLDECNGINGVWLLKTNKCLKSLVNFTEAVSPAFVINGYDMTSGKYATWTESVWTSYKVQMFMQPSQWYEWLVCLTGVLVFGFSFALTYSVKKNANELFDYPNLISASNI